MDEGQIREYIRANLVHFGPAGLGWQRPGGLPKYYAQHPEEWADDLAMVEYLRKTDAARARAAAAADAKGQTTASTGVSEDTRRLFDSVRRLARAGCGVQEIATELSMPERAHTRLQVQQPGCRGTRPWPVDCQLPAELCPVAGYAARQPQLTLLMSEPGHQVGTQRD